MPALLVKINVDDKGNVAIEKLSKNAAKAQPRVKSLGDTMRKAFAVVGVYKGINLLTAKLTQATDEALKFEKAMKKIKAIGNESGKTMQVMGKDIEKLALTTEHSFTQIAEAQLGISKAGIRGAEGLEVLKHALDLATVAGEEQGAVSEGLINILNAFGMGTEDAGYAANVMSRALNETILNLEEYLEAMKYSAPVASQLGVSFEELSAIIGILAQTGQRGSLAGTGLRNVLLNMLKLTPETAKSLEKVKIEEMGVTQLLETLHENGLPVVDLLKQFNKRGILAATALGKNAEAVYDLQSRLTDLSRPLNQVADEMRQNISDELERLNDHFVMIFNTLNEKLGAGGSSVLENLMEKIVEFNTALKDNPELLKSIERSISLLGNAFVNLSGILVDVVEHAGTFLTILGTAKLVSTASKIGLIAGEMAKVEGAFTAASVASKSLFKGMLGPIGIAILAVEGLELAIKGATVAWEAYEKAQEAKTIDKRLEMHLDALNAVIKLYDVVRTGEFSRDHLEAINDQEKTLADLGSTIDFAAGAQKKLNQAYEEYNKLTKSSGKIDLGDPTVSSKISEKIKQYGSNLNLPIDKDKKKDFDDFYGKIFDMHKAPIFTSPQTISTEIRMNEKGDLETLEMFDTFGNMKIGAVKNALQRLQAGWTEKVYPSEDVNLDTDKWAEFFKLFEKKQKTGLEAVGAFAEKYSAVLGVVNPITDAIGSRIDYLHERQMQIYDEEMEKLQEKYDLEIEAAGDSALQKSLAENKFQKEKAKLEAKANEENKKYAQKQWLASMAQIALNGPMMAVEFIGSFVKFGMLPPAAIPAGIALAAGVTGLQLGIAAANNPADAFVRGGRVNGNGNSTSDSVYARLSVGEHVLSRDDVERLGGDSAVERMITRGANSAGTSTTIYIDSIIGEESYVRRNIIPCIREELKR